MIGLQEIVKNNNISVIKLGNELNINPSLIWRWFKTNNIPKKYLKCLSDKLGIEESYLNKKVNDIIISQPQRKGFNNQYKIDGDITYIYYTNRKGKEFTISIDTKHLQKLIDLDCPISAQYYKRIDGYYAKVSVYEKDLHATRSYFLHKIILGIDDGRNTMVHHKNGDTLNNTEENLDATTNAINVQLRNRANTNNKTTGFRNVHMCRCYDGTYELRVQIMKDYKHYRWNFPINQLEEAKEFARLKRIEFFGHE